eukprot:12235415-Alexandrium_andersonii.AAC.1
MWGEADRQPLGSQRRERFGYGRSGSEACVRERQRSSPDIGVGAVAAARVQAEAVEGNSAEGEAE